MAYINSNPISCAKFSPNHSGQCTHSIDRITPHCVMGQLSIESICGCLISPSRQVSCNYDIGEGGRISLCVGEKNHSWCSPSNANDQHAVTIECVSDMSKPYAMDSAVYNSLIKLYTDVCRRNGKMKLLWLVDKNKILNCVPKPDEMVLTVRRWFASKSCLGNWLYSRLGDLAAEVAPELSKTTPGSGTASTSRMYRARKIWSGSKSQPGTHKMPTNAKRKADENAGYKVFDASGNIVYPTAAKPTKAPAVDTSHKVQIDIANLNIRKGPDANYGKAGQSTGKGIFTIVQESKDEGATLWGKLRSGVGWTFLDLAKKI